MKENRIIVPKTLQTEMLKEIHESHLGMTKCKQLARDYIFWPGMDKQIEDTVSRCCICQSFKNMPHSETLINHDIPDIPINKIGVDFFQMNQRNFLILVDYY